VKKADNGRFSSSEAAVSTMTLRRAKEDLGSPGAVCLGTLSPSSPTTPIGATVTLMHVIVRAITFPGQASWLNSFRVEGDVRTGYVENRGTGARCDSMPILGPYYYLFVVLKYHIQV
jgi:hypothetical protein